MKKTFRIDINIQAPQRVYKISRHTLSLHSISHFFIDILLPNNNWQVLSIPFICPVFQGEMAVEIKGERLTDNDVFEEKFYKKDHHGKMIILSQAQTGI